MDDDTIYNQYIVDTDLIDDFQKEEFLSLLQQLANIGCTVYAVK